MNANRLYQQIQEQCGRGFKKDIDDVIGLLNNNVDIATTKVIDYYLSTVSNEEGLNRIEFYLFNGTQMQRNYCTLFFARRYEWDLVHRAYRLGLIDEIQAYAR
ncbi:MAG: hypothetical protein GY754_22425 [bacterium]|nr:hypothetical protein [bacterium]